MTKRDFITASRKISFSIDESKTRTEEDNKLLAAYLELHEREDSLKLRGSDLARKFKCLNNETEAARVALKTVKTHIAALSALADGFIMIDPNKYQKAKRIIDQANKVSEEIAEYQQVIGQLGNKINAGAALNSAYISDVENMEPWDAYEEIKGEHFRNYEMNAIDIVSFELDDERFRDFASICDAQNEQAIDFSNDVLNNYNRLILETNVQYGIWDEFLKRLSLIRQVVADRADEIFTSAN